MVVSSLTSSKYWDIGEICLNWAHFRPNSRLSQKQNEFIDVSAIVHQASNRHIQLVMNNLKFIISHYLAAKKSGFWIDAESLLLVHTHSIWEAKSFRQPAGYNTPRDNVLHKHTQYWSTNWNRGVAACLERYVQHDKPSTCVTLQSSLRLVKCFAQLQRLLW